jgi:hypothetical protein
LNTLNTGQPKPTFFLDKNHGLLIRDFLGGLRIPVMVHRSFGWPPEMPDVDWIAACGRNDWVILSGDKKIELIPEERQAVIDAKCKVFMFDDSHKTTTHDWIASLVVARSRIFQLVTECNGPFFVTLRPCRSSGHVSEPRFVAKAGGGWRIIETVPTAKPQHAGRSRPVKKQQMDLDL